nr:MAG TPA: hypothetical protein [Bacteriophage sp.]
MNDNLYLSPTSIGVRTAVDFNTRKSSVVY